MSQLECSLVGTTEVVRLSPNSLARRAYGRDEASESFRCNYGLNPAYQSAFASQPLQITGTDSAGAARIAELSGHPFFVATLFLPQLGSQPAAPHPLVLAYLAAAGAFRVRAGLG